MRRIVAASLVAVVLLPAGCTEDPEPRFAEPSESASESSRAAAPEPWEKKTKAGAVAFARHWVDVFNKAQASGKTTQLRAASTPQCKTCNGFIGQLEALYERGGRYESDGWRVLLAAPGPNEVRSEAQVNLRIARPPERITRANGEVQRFPGGKATFSAELEWAAPGWKMTRLVRFE